MYILIDCSEATLKFVALTNGAPWTTENFMEVHVWPNINDAERYRRIMGETSETWVVKKLNGLSYSDV